MMRGVYGLSIHAGLIYHDNLATITSVIQYPPQQEKFNVHPLLWLTSWSTSEWSSIIIPDFRRPKWLPREHEGPELRNLTEAELKMTWRTSGDDLEGLVRSLKTEPSDATAWCESEYVLYHSFTHSCVLLDYAVLY